MFKQSLVLIIDARVRQAFFFYSLQRNASQDRMLLIDRRLMHLLELAVIIFSKKYLLFNKAQLLQVLDRTASSSNATQLTG